jgi:hypothetical protein
MSSALHCAFTVRGATALLMMRCRTGTAESSGVFPLEACGGPRSAAHRFAFPRPEMKEALVYALALRRIRDTATSWGLPPASPNVPFGKSQSEIDQ